jgi:hypothetical protein
MVWQAGVMLCLAWGALAFGSNYPWAYGPLMMGTSIVGVAGIFVGRSRRAFPTPVFVSLLLVAAVIVFQIVPLSERQLGLLSPHASELIAQRELTAVVGQTTRHPISIAPRQTLLGLGFFGSFGILLVGTASALTRKTATRLAASIAILGVVLAVVGIVQQATFNGKIYGFWTLIQGGTPFGPFVNRNHYAGWMLLAIPVAVGYLFATVTKNVRRDHSSSRDAVIWLSTPEGSRAVLAGFAVLVMILSLVLTLSRSGITAFSVALLLTGLVTGSHERVGTRRRVVVIYFMVVAITVISWVGLDQILARFASVDLTSVNQRPAIWADTVRIIKDFWLTGTGFNTYGVSTLFYQTSVPGKHLREAHNDYLQLMAEGGLLVSLTIVTAVTMFVIAVRRRLREDIGSIWWIRIGAITGLIGIAVQSLVEFSLQMPGNAALFAVVGGLAIHDGRRG